MPALFHDDILDAALQVIRSASSVELHICSGTPATRAAVISSSLATVALSSGDIGAQANASPDGRGITIAAKSTVAVSASGAPAHYCLIDGSRLLARTEVAPGSPDLTNGSTVDISAVTFSIADPTSV